MKSNEVFTRALQCLAYTWIIHFFVVQNAFNLWVHLSINTCSILIHYHFEILQSKPSKLLLLPVTVISSSIDSPPNNQQFAENKYYVVYLKTTPWQLNNPHRLFWQSRTAATFTIQNTWIIDMQESHKHIWQGVLWSTSLPASTNARWAHDNHVFPAWEAMRNMSTIAIQQILGKVGIGGTSAIHKIWKVLWLHKKWSPLW